MIEESDSTMSEATEKNTRRELRRAFGPTAVDTLHSQTAVINSLRIELAAVRGNHHDLQTDFRTQRAHAELTHRASDARANATALVLQNHLMLGFFGRLAWLVRGWRAS